MTATHAIAASILTILATCGIVRAGEAADLVSEIDALNSQIQQAVRARRATPEGEQKRQAVETARQAREADEASLPGVQDIDQKIEQLRQQIHELTRARNRIVRQHRPQIDERESELREAEDNYARVTIHTPDVQSLIKRRNRLAKRLGELEDAWRTDTSAPVE